MTPAREYLQRQMGVGSASDREIDDPEASGEFFIPVYNPTPACLLDYLPRQALVVTDNLQAVQDQVLEFEEQAVNLRRDSLPMAPCQQISRSPTSPGRKSQTHSAAPQAGTGYGYCR